MLYPSILSMQAVIRSVQYAGLIIALSACGIGEQISEVIDPPAYVIGGTVTGLQGAGLVLQNQGDDDLTIESDGRFEFNTMLEEGDAYDIAVAEFPRNPTQLCTIDNHQGRVLDANVTNIQVSCVTAFALGGTVTGLAGSGLVLTSSVGDIAINTNGEFVASNPVLDQQQYSISIKTQPSLPNQVCSVSNGEGQVSGADVSSVSVNCVTEQYTVGGTINNFVGDTLILQNNAGDTLALTPTTEFTFPTALDDGSSYHVTVTGQPSTPSQTCVVTSGSGNISGAAVSNVEINCSISSFTIGGSVSGLSGTGLVLQNNAGNNTQVTTNGLFTFSQALPDQSAYTVTVLTQPSSPGQTCQINNATGNLAGSNVSNVGVSCVTNTHTVGGTVTGLQGSGLRLRINNSNELAISSNGSFIFSNALNDGSPYTISIAQQPTNPAQTCTVASGSGTISGSNVVNVSVSCSVSTFTIGGTVSGLAGAGLVLQNNGGNNLAVSNNGAFTFTQPLTDLSNYAVTVLTQPTGLNQTCSVTGGTGTLNGSNITNIAINCATETYTLGGTVSGLAGNGLILRNTTGGEITISANGGFSFGTALNDGSNYNVVIAQQPENLSQTCSVTNGSGTFAGSNVSNVNIACATNRFRLGVHVNGLSGSTLVLRNNGSDNLAVSGAGDFVFSTPVLDGSGYDVTIFTGPDNGQNCNVSNPVGTIAGADVLNISVNCVFQSTISLDVTPMSRDVEISWPGGGSAYNLYYASEKGFDPLNYASYADGTMISGVSSPYTVTNLVNGRNYYFVLEEASNNRLTTEFSARPNFLGVDGVVQDLAADSAQNVYMGGTFNRIGPVTGSAAPLDKVNGKIAVGDFPMFNGIVNVIEADGAGGWYVGGAFTRAGDVDVTNIVHIKPDGSVNTDWTPAVNNEVLSIKASGSVVYIGGAFYTVNGVSQRGIAALDNVTGALTSWRPTISSGRVNQIVLQSGRVYIAGSFSTVNGSARRNLAALNSDASLHGWNPAPDNAVDYIYGYNGTLYIYGRFANIGGQPRARLASVSTSNHALSSWNPGINGTVRDMYAYNNALYMVGSFSQAASTSRPGLAAFNISTGALLNTVANVQGSMNTIRIENDIMYIGGRFTEVQNQVRKGLAAISLNGVLQAWNPNSDGEVHALAIGTEYLYVGGEFELLGGEVRAGLAAMDANDRLLDWAPVVGPNGNNIPGVNKLLVSGSTVYVGGEFGSINGQVRMSLAAVTTAGVLTGWNPVGNAFNAPSVSDLALAGSTLYASSSFFTFPGGSRIVRITTSGTGTISAFGPTPDAAVYDIEVVGSTVYYGGYFTNVGATTRRGIAAVSTSGALQPFNANLAVNIGTPYVNAIASDGSNVYFTGRFNSVQNQTRLNVAALTTGGTVTSWYPDANTSSISELLLDGNTLYAAGTIVSNRSASRRYVAGAFDRIGGTVTSWNPGFTSSNNGTSLLKLGNKIYVGGSFSYVQGQPRSGLAIFHTDGTLQ